MNCKWRCAQRRWCHAYCLQCLDSRRGSDEDTQRCLSCVWKWAVPAAWAILLGFGKQILLRAFMVGSSHRAHHKSRQFQRFLLMENRYFVKYNHSEMIIDLWSCSSLWKPPWLHGNISTYDTASVPFSHQSRGCGQKVRGPQTYRGTVSCFSTFFHWDRKLHLIWLLLNHLG